MTSIRAPSIPSPNDDRPTIRVLGIPMDLGQLQRGVDMGPSAIRYAGLTARLTRLGHRVEDSGNLNVPAHVSVPEPLLLPTIARICEETYNHASQAIATHRIPLFLGGDHSVSIGTIGGVTHGRPTGVLWIDAHGDFNTPETSITGNVHGMPLAILLGRGEPTLVDVGRPGPKLRPADVAVLGLRQLDPRERELLKSSGTNLFTMRDIDELGASNVLRQALASLGHVPHLHVSLDMDAVDPAEAPGVGTAVRGGLTYREAQLLMEIIADTGKLASMDVVEVNPVLDCDNRTARIAVELVSSAFGKAIL